jgi:hypothetical protein
MRRQGRWNISWPNGIASTPQTEKGTFRGEIHHPQWPLQPAQGEISLNTMTEASGISLPTSEALLHFARRQDVVVWPPHRVSSS